MAKKIKYIISCFDTRPHFEATYRRFHYKARCRSEAYDMWDADYGSLYIFDGINVWPAKNRIKMPNVEE